MALVSTAAPYLALLREDDALIKTYALQSLNDIVDTLWPEIANNLNELELLYLQDLQEKSSLALLLSKVYYNLGDVATSLNFALLAGSKFDIEEKSQYTETIISKSIALYSQQNRKFSVLSYKQKLDSKNEIDSKLTTIFERMVQKCVDSFDYKLALGVSLESYRLDLVELTLGKISDDELALSLINYVLSCTNTVDLNIDVKTEVLTLLVRILISLHSCDFSLVFKIVVQLNDPKLAAVIFKYLINGKPTKPESSISPDSDLEDYLDAELFDAASGVFNSLPPRDLIASQGAFDLVSTVSQDFLDKIIEILPQNDPDYKKLLLILSGIPTCDLDLTFLHQNNNTDITILNKTKNLLESRLSIYHNAVTFSNAFMYAGTTDDSFFRKNLEWLGKATNWSKFSATAALGVIHKGNLSQGKSILRPYLPGSSSAPHTKGGSLFALGLIFAGHGREIIDYLKVFLDEHGSSAGSSDTDIMLHGAALGVGVAGMGSNSESLYEALKVVLYSDSAISGQAAGIAMGLIKLATGNKEDIRDMLTYALETQHGNITRGLAIGIALINLTKGEEAQQTIDELMSQESLILRYGGAFTIGLAYAGTGNNKAIKQLLHHAVSDPSDDVRRAAVTSLGFVLIRDYQSTPQIVELLSQSHNPHVRYGTALALGISCAGKAYAGAIEVLEPLTKDAVDFVRQAALMATSMILIQQTESTYPKVKQFTKQYADTIKNKHEDALAKFGATLSQGIIDAGGRNVTISLENSTTGTLNIKGIVGLAIFAQSWYWFPFSHFLSLSFTPTSIIGVKGDLKAPKFEVNCHTKSDIFQYPPKVEESKEKLPDKIATAVLSTTAKAKNYAKKKQNKKDHNGDINIDEKEEEKEEKIEEKEEEKKDIIKDGKVEEKSEDPVLIRYSKTPYIINNSSRVLPAQANYISFTKDDRFVPVRKLKGTGGIIVFEDTKPDEPVEIIRTVRQLNITEAPVPEPFTLSAEDLKSDEE